MSMKYIHIYQQQVYYCV